MLLVGILSFIFFDAIISGAFAFFATMAKDEYAGFWTFVFCFIFFGIQLALITAANGQF